MSLVFSTSMLFLKVALSTTYCTMDVQICPDGSYVSRNPSNNCAFDPCPEISESAETGWSSLKTTWNLNPFAAFYNVPLTRDDAESKGWKQLMTCADTNSPGNVYLEDDDLSSMPIYNAFGNITGIILGMDDPGDSFKESPFTQYTKPDGTTFWGIQGNFKDPQYTCNENIAESQYTTGKVGDILWITNGNGNNEYYKAPLDEDVDALEDDGWHRGACFWTMGVHYWRYMSVDMDCDDAYPIFLLYNGGQLNAWGIALAHSDRPDLKSKKWEHPGGSVLKKFFQKGETPTCLPNQGELSTQHVYMDSPTSNFC